MSPNIIPVAQDNGYGNTKIAYYRDAGGSRDAGIYVGHFPSVVGLGRAEVGLLKTGLNGRPRQLKPYTVEFGGVSYLAGHNVHHWCRPSERLDFERLTAGPELRALTYAAWASVFSSTTGRPHHLAVLAGFPVEVLQDRPRGQAALASLKSWLVGTHEFRVDGRDYAVSVTAVKAMAQPLGSYFTWGLDEAGRWVRSNDDYAAPVAVADIGFNTLDLFGIEKGQVVGRLTGGQSLGMHRAAAAVKRHVRDTCGVDLSLGQADALVRDQVHGRPAAVFYPGGSLDVAPQAAQALDECFAGVNEFLREHWSAGSFRHLILTGGGVEALRQPLLRHWPAAIILPEPVTANANGLARFARKLFAPRANTDTAMLAA